MRPLVVKLLFRLRHPLLLQLSIELVASLNVRPVFASNELLSVLSSLYQTPDAVFALRRSGRRRGSESNCISDPPPWSETDELRLKYGIIRVKTKPPNSS